MIFPQKIPSETWTHPPTSIVNWDFWKFFLFAKPLTSFKIQPKLIELFLLSVSVRILPCINMF